MKLFRLLFVLLLSLSLDAKINFTDAQQEWMKNNPIVKVGVDANWPPFDFIDDTGTHQGISSEYLNLISSYTNLKFEIHADNWNNVMKKIQNKEIDILACAAKTVDREKYLNFTESYLDVDIVVVAKKSIKLDSFEEIQEYRVTLPKGNFVHEKLKNRFPNMKFVFVNSNEEALKALSYGEADVYIGNLPVVSYFVDKHLLTNIEVKFKADFKKAQLSIAVVKEKKILYDILQKILENIKEDESQTIKKKWVFSIAHKKSIDFSVEEKEWLRKNKTIQIAGDPFWPPYSFNNDKGEYLGIVPELISMIFFNSGIELEYVKSSNWTQTLDLAKNKKIKIIDAISHTKKRAEYLNFSSKYLGAEIVIIANKNNDTYVNTLKNISEKKIATVKGYSVIEKIKADYPLRNEILTFENPLEGLAKLSNSQIDYFILDIPSFEYYSKKYGLSNLKIVGPTGYSYEYGLGILKEEKELFSIVNKLLNSISQEKKDEIYRKWIQVEYDQKVDYDLIWKIVIIALFALIGTIYWNRKLQLQIEEKERIQADLEQSHDFINSIMDSQISIVIATTGEKITQANKSFFDFVGYENLEKFKEDYTCICDLFDVNNPKKYLIPIKNNKTWIEEVITNNEITHKALIYKDNIAYIFKVTASYVSEKSSLKTAVFTDITKLEDLNEVLVKAKDEALNATKQKSEFLANMSHEIRTPMNSVIGFAELLDKEITDPIQKDYLGSIKKGGQALLGIINDILDLSKIEAGKLEIKNESINPKSLFFEIESIFETKIMSKNLNFIVEIDKSIPNYIIIDGVRLRQILFNLIGNAIKFTEKGDIKLKVENIYKDNTKSKIDLIFSVQDSGIGIDEKDQKTIFNAFEQQTDQNIQKYGGTGLGLAICSKLVSMMNGEIKLSSKKNQGSTFTVSLKDIAVSSLSNEPICQKIDISNIKFEKATILVVDDVFENRKLVQASLKTFDFEIIMATDGKDAIEKLKTINIDFIFMDLRMPIMNGYEAADYIKKDTKFKEIPLIALTASVMGKDLDKVSQFGFDGYLRKPVIIDDLIVELCKYLTYDFLSFEKKNEESEDEEINQKNLEFVINALETTLIKTWKKIKSSGDFMLIEEFSYALEELSTQNKIAVLNKYAKELQLNIESFDIERVDYIMNNFNTLIDKIKALRTDV